MDGGSQAPFLNQAQACLSAVEEQLERENEVLRRRLAVHEENVALKRKLEFFQKAAGAQEVAALPATADAASAQEAVETEDVGVTTSEDPYAGVAASDVYGCLGELDTSAERLATDEESEDEDEEVLLRRFAEVSRASQSPEAAGPREETTSPVDAAVPAEVAPEAQDAPAAVVPLSPPGAEPSAATPPSASVGAEASATDDAMPPLGPEASVAAAISASDAQPPAPAAPSDAAPKAPSSEASASDAPAAEAPLGVAPVTPLPSPATAPSADALADSLPLPQAPLTPAPAGPTATEAPASLPVPKQIVVKRTVETTFIGFESVTSTAADQGQGDSDSSSSSTSSSDGSQSGDGSADAEAEDKKPDVKTAKSAEAPRDLQACRSRSRSRERASGGFSRQVEAPSPQEDAALGELLAEVERADSLALEELRARLLEGSKVPPGDGYGSSVDLRGRRFFFSVLETARPLQAPPPSALTAVKDFDWSAFLPEAPAVAPPSAALLIDGAAPQGGDETEVAGIAPVDRLAAPQLQVAGAAEQVSAETRAPSPSPARLPGGQADGDSESSEEKVEAPRGGQGAPDAGVTLSVLPAADSDSSTAEEEMSMALPVETPAEAPQVASPAEDVVADAGLSVELLEPAAAPTIEVMSAPCAQASADTSGGTSLADTSSEGLLASQVDTVDTINTLLMRALKKVDGGGTNHGALQGGITRAATDPLPWPHPPASQPAVDPRRQPAGVREGSFGALDVGNATAFFHPGGATSGGAFGSPSALAASAPALGDVGALPKSAGVLGAGLGLTTSCGLMVPPRLPLPPPAPAPGPPPVLSSPSPDVDDDDGEDAASLGDRAMQAMLAGDMAKYAELNAKVELRQQRQAAQAAQASQSSAAVRTRTGEPARKIPRVEKSAPLVPIALSPPCVTPAPLAAPPQALAGASPFSRPPAAAPQVALPGSAAPAAAGGAARDQTGLPLTEEDEEAAFLASAAEAPEDMCDLLAGLLGARD